MDENQYIINYIIDYIKSDMINPSAIMIDGEWGSGKTYFVLNNLIKEIRNRLNGIKIAYVTLNGVSSVQELNKRIKTAIIKFNKEKKDRFSIVDGIDTQILEENINKISLGYIKNLLNVGKNIYANFKLKNSLFIFDDLERIEMKPQEYIGIINDLVEHKKCKCILIGNDAEIKKENYERIKEKLISRTLYFKGDLESFLFSIYDRTFCSKIPEKYGKELWNEISKSILNINNKNIRTLLSAISVANTVYSKLEYCLKDNNEVNKRVLKDMFLDIYNVEIWNKLGKEKPIFKDESKYYDNIPFGKENLIANYSLTFCYTPNLIYNGILDDTLIEKSYSSYYNLILSKINNSPLNVLKDWYCLEDDVIQQNYDKLITLIEDDKIPVEDYFSTVYIIFKMNDLEFHNSKMYTVESIINKLKNNIEKHNYFNFEFDIFKADNYDEYRCDIKNTLVDFQKISENKLEEKIKKDLNEILTKQEWADQIKKYVINNKNIISRIKKIFSLMDLDILYQNIENADNEELHSFRLFLQHINNINYLLNDDEEVKSIKEFYNKLDNMSPNGKVKKQSFII